MASQESVADLNEEQLLYQNIRDLDQLISSGMKNSELPLEMYNNMVYGSIQSIENKLIAFIQKHEDLPDEAENKFQEHISELDLTDKSGKDLFQALMKRYKEIMRLMVEENIWEMKPTVNYESKPVGKDVENRLQKEQFTVED